MKRRMFVDVEAAWRLLQYEEDKLEEEEEEKENEE